MDKLKKAKVLGTHVQRVQTPRRLSCLSRTQRKAEQSAKDIPWIVKNVKVGREFIIDQALLNLDVDNYYDKAVNLQSEEDKVIEERHKKCLEWVKAKSHKEDNLDILIRKNQDFRDDKRKQTKKIYDEAAIKMKGIDEDEAKKLKMQLSKKIKISRDAQLKKWADKQASNRTKLE